MSLELDLIDPIDTNSDGTILEVYDNTGDGNSGWGSGSNPDYTDIDGVNYFLTLEITIYTPDDTDGTTYDEIDFYTWFGQAPSSLDDLVFLLDMTDLTDSGSAAGTDEDNFPDGMYKFTYTLKDDLDAEVDSYEAWSLITTQVANDIYDLVAEVPESYLQNSNIIDSDDYLLVNKLNYLESFLEGMNSNISEARTSKLLEMLTALETLITDYPNF